MHHMVILHVLVLVCVLFGAHVLLWCRYVYYSKPVHALVFVCVCVLFGAVRFFSGFAMCNAWRAQQAFVLSGIPMCIV